MLFFRHYKIDDIARVGLPLIDIELEGEGESSADEAPAKAESKQAPSQSQAAHRILETGKVLATPAVRRIAMENKVDNI